MPQGPLRTFFRQDAGMPEDEPDLTDFLLDSMMQQGRRPRTDAWGSPAPWPTSGGRVSSMAGMRGQQGQQGPAGPVGQPQRLPGMLGQMQGQPDVMVRGRGYPAMPGPPPAPSPMPQMAQAGWLDYLSQAGGGIADAMNARSGQRSDWFGRIQGQQQGMRDRDFQMAMAERGAMERAAQLAHEYDWKRYGAGQQEARQDISDDRHEADVKFRDKLLAAQKEKEAWPARLQAAILPGMFEKAESEEELDALVEKALRDTGGDPLLMKQVQDAAAIERKALEWKKVGRGTFFSDSPGGGAPGSLMTPSVPSWAPFQGQPGQGAAQSNPWRQWMTPSTPSWAPLQGQR